MTGDHLRHGGRHYGKYSGVVIDPADPDKVGKIKVSVPAVLSDLQVWARPCLPYGHFFVPPKDAHVWVEFEGGHTDYPIWVGTWYANGEVPADANISPPENRMIQTASGHAVEIDDRQGAERVLVRHKLDSFLSIDKDGNVLLANKNGSHVHLNAKDKQASVISEQGNVVSMSDKGIVITAKDGTTIEVGDGKIKLRGTGDVQILGNNISITGSGIALGGPSAAMTPMLVEKFLSIWAGHTHPSAMGPTGPPIPAPPLTPQTGGSSAVKMAP